MDLGAENSALVKMSSCIRGGVGEFLALTDCKCCLERVKLHTHKIQLFLLCEKYLLFTKLSILGTTKRVIHLD